MPGAVQFSATVIPSFFPEWGLGVSIEGTRYLVTHIVFDQSLAQQLGPEQCASTGLRRPRLETRSWSTW
jgi:hypothetical protein